MGAYLPADGKLPGVKEAAKQMFVIGEGKQNCLMGVVCAGPKSVCLAAYADVRGPDDIKLLARVVK